MRRGHRRAGQRLGGSRRVVPRGHDVDAGRKQIDAGAVVREVGTLVVGVGRADRDCCRDGRGRIATGIHAVVAGGHNDGHAVVDDRLHGCVECLGVATTEAHVGDCELAGCVVRGDPVEAGDHIGKVARAVTVEHADRDDADGRGDAIVGPTNCASDVGAVAIAVLGAVAVTDSRVATRDAATKLLVVRAYPGVDHVGSHARAATSRGISGLEVHGAVEREVALVDAVKAPGGGARAGGDGCGGCRGRAGTNRIGRSDGKGVRGAVAQGLDRAGARACRRTLAATWSGRCRVTRDCAASV